MEQEKDWFETEDLLIYPAHRDWAAEIADFYARNREFLAPFEPVRPESYYTVAGQKRELSGVSISSPSTMLPTSSRPNSNLVSAMMMPRVSA